MAIVTLADMKAELGITDTTDDAMISAKLDAAQSHLEALLGYSLEAEFPTVGAVEFPDTVPADIVGAVKMLTANAYENREATLVGLSAMETPFGVWEVVQNRRHYSWADNA